MLQSGLDASKVAPLMAKVRNITSKLRKSRKLRVAVATMCTRVRTGEEGKTLQELLDDGGESSDEE